MHTSTQTLTNANYLLKAEIYRVYDHISHFDLGKYHSLEEPPTQFMHTHRFFCLIVVEQTRAFYNGLWILGFVIFKKIVEID